MHDKLLKALIETIGVLVKVFHGVRSSRSMLSLIFMGGFLIILLIFTVDSTGTSFSILGSALVLSGIATIAAAYIALRLYRKNVKRFSNDIFYRFSISFSRTSKIKQPLYDYVADHMVKDRKRPVGRSIVILAVAILVYYFLMPNVDNEISWYPLGFGVGGLLIIVGNWLLIRYRISRGYYGYNAFEAKEIMTFLLRTRDDDNRHGGGYKQIVPNPTAEDPVAAPEIVPGAAEEGSHYG